VDKLSLCVCWSIQRIQRFKDPEIQCWHLTYVRWPNKWGRDFGLPLFGWKSACKSGCFGKTEGKTKKKKLVAKVRRSRSRQKSVAGLPVGSSPENIQVEIKTKMQSDFPLSKPQRAFNQSRAAATALRFWPKLFTVIYAHL